jgi:hypothetical protein
MERNEATAGERSSCLPLLLAAVLVGFLCVAAFIVTGGLVLYFLVPVLLLLAFIGLNYILWGWSMPESIHNAGPDPPETEAPDPSSDGFTELGPDDPRRARHD